MKKRISYGIAAICLLACPFAAPSLGHACEDGTHETTPQVSQAEAGNQRHLKPRIDPKWHYDYQNYHVGEAA